MRGRINQEEGTSKFGGLNLSVAELRAVDQIVITACGTSWHAGLIGEYLIEEFAHIPVETLSCVYELFLHDAQEDGASSRGKTLGAYFTPLPLADYVLTELESRRPLQPDAKAPNAMKVLDPACGSGAFLVQCYRRLIEKQRRIEPA